MKKESLALFFSFIAILISVVSICVACPRNQELGFDYQGVLVGVLSLLVTVLVGWKIDEISTGASLMIQKGMEVSENTNWMIYHYLLLKEDPLGLEYRFLYHGIACLFHTSQFLDIATCNSKRIT